MNAMMNQGFPQADYEIMKEACDRKTNRRVLFFSLCGVDKDTSKKGGMIRKLLEDQLVGLDISKEDNLRKLYMVVGKVHLRATEKKERLMMAGDF